jgi:hypothetical protein
MRSNSQLRTTKIFTVNTNISQTTSGIGATVAIDGIC